MRVLTLTNMYPSGSDSVWGVFVAEQVESLRKQGVEVDVLSFDGRARRLEYARAALQLRRRLRADRYDIVHAHYGLTGLVAATQRDVPVVTTFHGTDALGPAWQRTLSRVAARRTTPIFVTTEAGAALGIRAPAVVPCAVDLERFTPLDRRAARTTLGWDIDAASVVFPASPKRLVKNFALFEQVIELVRQHVPGLRTVTLDRFQRQEVPVVLGAADAIVMTSTREGSPVVAKEALACLTPVVATPVGDLPTLLDGLPGCAVESRAPELAAAVIRALEAPKSDLLRQRVLRYGPDAVSARIVAIYEAVAARSTVSRRLTGPRP